MTDWLDLMEGTWPAAARLRTGPWVVRDGQGGGSRVSSATAGGTGPRMTFLWPKPPIAA